MTIAPPPGEMIQEALDNNNLTRKQFIDSTTLNPACVDGLLASKHEINQEAAIALASFFGTSAKMWLGIQSAYSHYHPHNATTQPCDRC